MREMLRNKFDTLTFLVALSVVIGVVLTGFNIWQAGRGAKVDAGCTEALAATNFDKDVLQNNDVLGCDIIEVHR